MLEWLEQLNEEERIVVIRDAFSQVAKTIPGEVVFAVLFEQLYLFRACKDSEAVALSNFAKHLLDYFGEDVQLRIIETIVGATKHQSVVTHDQKGEENGN